MWGTNLADVEAPCPWSLVCFLTTSVRREYQETSYIPEVWDKLTKTCSSFPVSDVIFFKIFMCKIWTHTSPESADLYPRLHPRNLRSQSSNMKRKGVFGHCVMSFPSQGLVQERCAPCSLPLHVISKDSCCLALLESLQLGTFLPEQRGQGAIGVSCSSFIMINFCPLPCREASGQSVGRLKCLTFCQSKEYLPCVGLDESRRCARKHAWL